MNASTTAATYLEPLHIIHLRHHWPGATHPVLDVRDWLLPPGVHLLHGDSGCGKTTLLRILAGRERADVLQMQMPPAAPHAGDIAWPHAVFYDEPQAPHWAHSLPISTARAYIDAHLGAASASRTALQRARADLQHAFGLQPHEDKPLHMLSTGTRQKLMLLTALLCNAPLVLIDEPLRGLDQPSIRALWYALALHQRIGRQCLLIASATPAAQLPPLAWSSVRHLPSYNG